jgi:hypothetical protein
MSQLSAGCGVPTGGPPPLLPAGPAAFMAGARVPWSAGALGGAVTDPAWRAGPGWYLVAVEDRMIPPPAQPAPLRDCHHQTQLGWS